MSDLFRAAHVLKTNLPGAGLGFAVASLLFAEVPATDGNMLKLLGGPIQSLSSSPGFGPIRDNGFDERF